MLALQQTPIEQFKLPEKLIRLLRRNGIDTFGDLQDAVREGNLLRLRGVGEKIAGELPQLAACIAAQPDLYLVTVNQYNVENGENTPQAQSKSESLSKLDQVCVEKLELDQKIINSLRRVGICTIGDLLLIKPSRLGEINRIGSKAAREIRVALDKALSSPESYIR